jgi:hypothetical protein
MKTRQAIKDAIRASYYYSDAGKNKQTWRKNRLAPMLIAHVDALATVRANGLALLALLACTLWFPAFGIYAGQHMEAVVDWITILGVILGFAAGWLVGWRLKSQGAFPYGYVPTPPLECWGESHLANQRGRELNSDGDFMVT